ncbi:MAG: Cell surface protein [Candidatus Moranbacteria bacterium GW2011_GWC2_37_73]|nr:MAG: Cell surface protein [Candidatus Moranbacteria bacterium GW2011_GWC2_37_73]
MKTFFDKNTRYFTIMIVLILIFLFSTSSVMADEEKLFPGSVSGTGMHFEIVDSEYLNITLDSSENIKVRMESAPEMVVLETENLNAAISSSLIISGFLPNTTYYKYQDNYDTYQSFVSDEKGSFSFIQDISQRHLIFIQPRKSTKFITDVNGGDCSSIGVWNDTLKTCTLNQDVNDSVQIKSDNVTLDGNGHIITGKNTGTGVFIVNGKKGITIKNVTITGFFYGIYLSYYSGLNNISFATLTGNRYGAYLDHSGANVISNNVITKNSNAGLYLFYSTKNIFTDNIVGPENKNGISESSQNYGYTYDTSNVYENNEVFENLEGGIYIYGGNRDILKNNKIKNNPYYGIEMIESSSSMLFGNVMSGNGEHNFYISGNKVEDNDIDTSNTVEDKAVYFIKNVINEIYDNLDDVGIFYCTNCQNVTLKNLSLSENKALIYFKNTANSLIENIASTSEDIKIIFEGSSNNTIKNSIFERAYLSYSDSNQFYGNNIMGTGAAVFQINSSINNSFNLDLPIGGNFWKKNEANCRDLNNDNICDSSYVFGGGSDYYPRVNKFEFEAEPICQENCYSNVMFLPGHQASRLYRKDSDGDEDQLWEPTNHNEDVEQLYMNQNDGSSNDPGIYTRDILDEAYGINNVYKGFMASMDNIVADGVINKWQAFAYDWRKPLEDVVDNGTKLEDGSVENVLDQIRNSAKESKTGKVTLIGHSNGGLLAKVIRGSYYYGCHAAVRHTQGCSRASPRRWV